MKKSITKEELMEIIDYLDPKIKQSLRNTHFQEREDLEQEIKLKMIETYEKVSELDAPNFEEFLLEYLKKQI
ncbi:hypothetical protein [Niallia sp. Krafla_26]|uniref:hypothetical protein n=1 Tax=Niallia sp. Krafla_26 TaxID=3064703 RepID=UPI003D1787DD